MHHIIIQKAVEKTGLPSNALLRKWAKCALDKKVASAEVTIRIVDEEEMITLNHTYRHKANPTNVLSFPIGLPDDIPMKVPLLGDIVICASVVSQEAKNQHKSPKAHWAHMIVHGVCHLLGFDHEKEEDARIMEALEIEILNELGFANPYAIEESEDPHG